MAYDNFIPEIWAQKIERDLERDCVFAEDCNRQYEGQVSKCGDTVHILGTGKPTISTLARENASGDITGPEEVDGTDTILVIDQIRYFNFMVGDIDKAQAVDGVLDTLTKEANEGLADEVDKYIAALVANAGNTVTRSDLSKDNVLDALDEGQQKLYENDVKATTEVVVVIPPAIYTLFRRAYLREDTNNHEELKHGKVGKYGNMTVKLSNNVNKSGSTYNCMMRTKRAVAYAQPVRHVEAYRPQGKFADAVKGFILFGAKVVRPKEMVKLALTIAA
jgi:hypothetical protein